MFKVREREGVLRAQYNDYRLFIKLAAGTSAVDLIIYGNKSKDLYKKSQLKPYIIPQNNAGYGDD